MKIASCMLAVALLLSACGKIEKQKIVAPEAESAQSAAEKSARLSNAVYGEDIDAVREMLAAGADIDGRDEEGCTPLLVAVRRGTTELMGLLIAAGADINARYKELEVDEPEVDEKKVTYGGIIDLDLPYYDGETALHFVARHGMASVAHKLLRSGAKIDIRDTEGQIPLVEAVLANNLELVKLLVSHGASLNYRDENGRTLLHIVASDELRFALEENELVEFLVARGISPNATDNNGRTPLHEAADRGISEFVEFLIKNGATVNLVDSAGFTALDLALKGDHPYCISLFLQHNGRTSREEPANIPEAVLLGDIEQVRGLISLGKDVNENYTYGDTGLHYAAEKGNIDIAGLLVTCGAHLNEKNNIGVAPLFEAVSCNHLDVCRLLLEHGADVNEKGCLGRTPIHQAVVDGNLSVCELLVKNGADLNRKDKALRDYKGRTPLDWAIHKGHKAIEQLLRSHGAKTSDELREEDK